MTANHKNNLEINPILPTFGRSSGMPLGSVDLSLSSAARSTPSPKGNHLQPGSSMQQQQHASSLPSNIPPGLGGPPMPDQTDHFHHKMVSGHGTQQHQQLHHHNMNANHNRSPSANQIGGVIQSTAALKDRSGPHNMLGSVPIGTGNNGGNGPASCSFLGLGGNNLGLTGNIGGGNGNNTGGNGYYNMMSSNSGAGGNSGPCASGSNNSINRPSAGSVGGTGSMVPPSNTMGTAATSSASDFGPILPGGLHIKDAKQLNNDIGKSCRDNNSANSEPSDLVKDILLHAMQSNPIPPSPKRSSPVRTPVEQIQSPTRSRSSPLLPQQSAMGVNKPFPTISANVPSTTPSELTPDAATTNPKIRSPEKASGSDVSGSLPTVPAPPPPVTSRSAQAPSGGADRISPSQSITSNEDSADSNSSKARRRRKPDRTNKMSSDELERMHDFLGVGENSSDKCDRIDGIDPMRPNIAVRNDIATLALEGISSLSQGLASDSSHSPHITDLSDSTRINLQTLNESNSTTTGSGGRAGRNKSPKAVNSVISSVLSAAAAAVMESTRKDSDSTSDECETIDKIAAMISSTENDGSTGLEHGSIQLPGAVDSNLVTGAVRRPPCNGPANQTLPIEGSLCSGNQKPGSNSKHEADKSYEEIENKLEEMFAGIEETMPSCSKSSPTSVGKKSPAAVKMFSDPADILNDLSERNEEPASAVAAGTESENPHLGIPSTSGTQKKFTTPPTKRATSGKPVIGAPPNKRKKVLKKKAQSKGASFAAAEERAQSSKKALTKGKKKGNGGSSAAGNGNGKNMKVKPSEAGSITADLNGKYRGPFVQVKSDGSHMVINAPINEDDSDKPQNKTKKFAISMNNSEKSKIRGLHVSTLSTKYDADTTDTSWMCVFCKMGPHKLRLGDLFGPYIISTKSAEFEQSQTDEDYFSEKRTRESLASKMVIAAKSESVVGGTNPKSKKRKTAVEPVPSTSGIQQTKPSVGPSSTDIFYGMVKAGDDSFEVWMHEDCLIWAPGVYIIGTRIVGLEAAIWNCCRHQCQLCSNYGATVSCLHRGCSAEAHVICARKHHWTLSDEFKSLCDRHTTGPDS